ncbi:hypothetical protein BLA60_04625 [Actinophytocola xinjiangensis]|uniref:GAF domain-containing protein n=1 Tax=Actinophytocola xinjiangensis TaxID=485602 RepID=A0A7Z1B179_9PSEU|nr:GAF domain-containing SpoIIE family protein phosphatase [Actinophytocola xinjiangensis]OLF14410.1 hypothetical protein BLA60_04625 [Actinophytocola xinjiangensis]
MSKPASRANGAQERLSRIELVTDTALAHVELEDMQRELLERVLELLEADSAVVLMNDTLAGGLTPTVVIGLNEDLSDDVQVSIGRGFAGMVADRKGPVMLDQVDESTLLDRRLVERGVRCLLGVPMLAEGQVIGVLYVGSVTSRIFTDDDINLLQVAADRIALATQVASSRAERAAAKALHRSLLPARLPAVPGFSLAGRYLPGGDNGVGGDWYDAFTLPSGRLGLVIGDVVGHGLRAAVIMGRMRSVVRAYALETEDPAVVLEKLDSKLTHFEPGAMATAAYAVFDPGTHRLEISLAGHPPPVVCRPGTLGTVADIPPDLPVGTGLAPRRRRNHVLDVEPGGVVCLYTDGLVERRNASIDEGMGHLCDAVTVETADSVCTTVMDKLVAGHTPGDDIAVVVLCRDPAAEI